MRVKYSYLEEQFADVDGLFADLRELVRTGEFTIGPFVEKFERQFAAYLGVKHAIGTNTGTGALILCLKALGVGAGDEVITVANTFIATAGAIAAVGARPVFVDCDARYQMDATQLEAVITPRTKAILPVHWAGASPDLAAVLAVADRHGLPVVEDACPATGAWINGKKAGTFGRVSGFSMHPLKPLNVMGDGGIVVTDDDALAGWLRLYRNHGLVDRDHIAFWGVNERLQPFQAVVGCRMLDGIEENIAARIRNARLLDEGLAPLREFIRTPERPAANREVYQLYLALATRRDDLLAYLVSQEIECKVHYPIPLHLQQCAAGLGYTKGDFPVAERQAAEVITIPAHQHLDPGHIEFIIEHIRRFYTGRA
ncbi:MAG: DegT/DnrJ/EryC1/StrS family aminotransferase [Vicinamibacterales bacterium]